MTKRLTRDGERRLARKLRAEREARGLYLKDPALAFSIKNTRWAMCGDIDALYAAFVWDETREGLDFWCGAINELESGRPLPDAAREALERMIADWEASHD